MAEQWLSIVEYARTYSVSDMTVRRRIKTGKLHAVLKEGKYYIPVPVDGAGSARTSSRDQLQAPSRAAAREATPRRTEISVVKSHPLAQKTYPASSSTGDLLQTGPSHLSAQVDDVEVGIGGMSAPILAPDTPIPNSLRTGIEQRSMSMVDSRALLAFCDGSLRSSNAAEKKLEELYRTRFEALTQQLNNKNLEINSLKQQLEDMQLLVQILEKKRV